MTREINMTDALFAAISRVNELLSQDAVTELERDSLSAHLDYIKLNADKITAAASLLDVNVDDVVVIQALQPTDGPAPESE
jgi:hypothetical protein